MRRHAQPGRDDAPASSSDEHEAGAMLRDHVSVLPTGLAVLEDPATRRDAAAVSLQRAADTGHTWLSRLASSAS